MRPARAVRSAPAPTFRFRRKAFFEHMAGPLSGKQPAFATLSRCGHLGCCATERTRKAGGSAAAPGDERADAIEGDTPRAARMMIGSTRGTEACDHELPRGRQAPHQHAWPGAD